MAEFEIKKSATIDAGLKMALVYHKKWKEYFILCKGTEVDWNDQTFKALDENAEYPIALAMARKWQSEYRIELICAHS